MTILHFNMQEEEIFEHVNAKGSCDYMIVCKIKI